MQPGPPGGRPTQALPADDEILDAAARIVASGARRELARTSDFCEAEAVREARRLLNGYIERQVEEGTANPPDLPPVMHPVFRGTSELLAGLLYSPDPKERERVANLLVAVCKEAHRLRRLRGAA